MTTPTAAIRREAPPGGYVELGPPSLPARVTGMARSDVSEQIAAAVSGDGTLHGWASRQPSRRAMHGRGVAWAVALPGGLRVVVRHNRHGGLLAPVTGDRFLAPTRAPVELRTALRLAAGGVATPEVVAYLTYPAPPFGTLLRRADVATAEIAGGHDLPAALGEWPDQRSLLLEATARLLASLSRIGARHPDLNVKNVLLTLGDGAAMAHVLDVDRIIFGNAGDMGIARANFARLDRSARKWHERHGQPLLDSDESTMLMRQTLEGR